MQFDFLMGTCIGFGLIIQQPSAFWRRKIFDELGGVREDLHFYMDGEYWQRISKSKYNIKHIPVFLANARWHDKAKIYKNQITNATHHYEREFLPQLEKGYQSLKISKMVSFKMGKFLMKVYKVKRIFQRLIRGHYWICI